MQTQFRYYAAIICTGCALQADAQPTSTSSGQAYPVKSIRIVVPFPAGGGVDATARVVGQKLSQQLGQTVTIDNRAGAAGTIGADHVAKSAPDGYTLLLGTASTHMIIPNVTKTPPYDPLKDFTPVSILITPATSVVILNSLPVRSMQELVAYGKANPGKLAFGSNGVATSSHLYGELLKMAGGFDMLHVPYKGSNEAMAALIAEHIQMFFSSPGPTRPHVQSGKLRLLGVLSPKRFSGTPDVPTVAESLPGYEPITDWFGVFGAGSMPGPVTARLHAEIVKALNQPEVRTEFDKLTYVVIGNSPEEFAALMKREFQIYGKIIRSVNIPLQ